MGRAFSHCLRIAAALAFPAVAGAGDAVPIALTDGIGGARITIGHWPEGGWSVQQFANLVEIRFPGAAMALEVGGLPLAVSEGHVLEATSELADGATILRLTLGCACAVAIMGDGRSSVSIDVVGDVFAAATSSGPAPETAPQPPPRRVADPGPDGPLDAETARLRLLRELERAAAAGMITLADPDDPDFADAASAPAEGEGTTGESDAGSAPDPDDDRASRTTPAGPPTARLDAAESAGDHSMSVAGGSSPEHPDAPSEIADEFNGDPEGPGETCLPDSKLDFAGEDETQPVAARIASLSAALIGEFDRPDPETAVSLARLYLQAGLGAEARQVLEAFAPLHPTRPALARVAAVLEGDAGQPPPAPQDCGGAHALWIALGLALAGDAQAALAAEARSGRALERLPAPLRLLAAARLGHAAADMGDWQGARRFHAMGERSAVGADPGDAAALGLLAARLALHRGEDGMAEDLLARLARRGDETGLQAQLLLAGAVLDGRATPPAGTLRGLIADLGASALTHRGTPVGARAMMAEAELLALLDGAPAALDLAALGVATGVLDAAAQARIASALTAADGAAPAAGDALARAYIADPERFSGSLADRGFRAALASSLAEAGFPGIAEAALGDAAEAGEVVRLAVARAHLATGATDRAAALAAGLPRGSRRDELLARAALAAGDAEAAWHLLEASRGADAPMAAWLAGDWAGVADMLDSAVTATVTPDEAVRLALAARRAGATELPAAARETLASAAPDLLPGLEALFRAGLPVSTPADAGRLADDAGLEAQSFRRLLEDG